MISNDNLRYIVDHVFLPPKLPQKHDSKTHTKDGILLGFVAAASKQFADTITRPLDNESAATRDVWHVTQKMLKTMGSFYANGGIIRERLQAALEQMDSSDVLPVLVEAQNAGVIFRKITCDIFTFEAFELSLPTEVVIGARGKIAMRFPTNPPLPFAVKDNVLSILANVLAHLSTSLMQESMPFSKKGGESHFEARNTANPCFITEALAGIIRAIPPRDHVPINDGEIHKRLDDHVLWKSALKPWRRSSMWLLIRVAIQTTHQQWYTGSEYGYKAFQAFLMASVLDMALKSDPERFTVDLLGVMNAKLAKRLCKIGAIIEDSRFPALKMAVDVVSRTSKTLEKRWRKVQQQHECTVQWSPDPAQIHLGDCLSFSFRQSRDFILDVINWHDASPEGSNVFDRDALEATLSRSIPPQVPASPAHLPKAPSSDVESALQDIEMWIEVCLESWEKSPLRSEKDCLPLSSLIDEYRKRASNLYQNNPELLSLMHLCVMELWVALDRICVKWSPLFREFSPEIAQNFADPLVLPYFRQMKRLDRVQSYLRSRHQSACAHGTHSIFRRVNSANSFQNRYFDNTNAMPLFDLQAQILKDAANRKAAKISELQAINKKYDDLMQESRSQACVNNVLVSKGGVSIWEHREHKCPKCRLRNQASNLRIIPLEDPLPKDILRARPIIFELRCPLPFAIWRDSTMKIILSILGVEAKPNPSRELYPLVGYNPLMEYFREPYDGCRVGFASSMKSLERSHYGKGQNIPAIKNQVLFEHKGAFDIYDKAVKGWIETGEFNGNLRSACAFQVEGPYRTLQIFVNDTRHAPNSVISTVSKVPDGVSPAEYTTFGLLRAGNRIQWRNIMRAIKSQTLPFSDPAVLSLVVQSIWQAGPVGDVSGPEKVHREAHIDLLDEEFGRQVAEEILRNVKALGSNWKESNFLAILVVLSLRLQAFTPHWSVKALVRVVLSEVRNVAMNWVRTLFSSSLPHESRKVLQDHKPQALANVAVVLRASFDVEDDSDGIFPSSYDVAIYIYTAVLISAVQTRSFPPGIRLLAYRNQRMALRVEPHLIEACLGDRCILQEVVAMAWPEYSGKIQWGPLSTCGNKWWSSTKTTLSQCFHVNIIDGTLLIDGKASDQLPSIYGNAPIFVTLFKDSVFRAVRPSPLRDMEYVGFYGSHEVHFGRLGKRLIILRREGTDIQEYLPMESLEKDLPTVLSTGCCYWYSREKHSVEVRRLSQAWVNADEQNWNISLEDYTAKLVAQVGKRGLSGMQNLVDPESTVHRALVKTLHPLEPNPRGLFITSSSENANTIFVHLPRHNLNFCLRKNNLECLSLPGYVVDANLVGIGCLFGLRSLLNLRHASCRQAYQKIIVPKGLMVLNSGIYGTARISIDVGESKGYFVYDVDTLKGQLVGTRSMESDLYLAKIHAFTASSRPDPLTQRTGTEEALRRLANASTLSFYTISKESMSYLDDIIGLTPIRSYYPAHLQAMETVDWNEYLPMPAQHPRLRARVEHIISSWRDMVIFLQTDDLTKPQLEDLLKRAESPPGFEHLTYRTMIRDWNNCPSSETQNSIEDLIYVGRGSLATAACRDNEHRTFRAANVILNQTVNLPPCKNLQDTVLQWNTIEGSGRWRWDSVEEWLRVPVARSIGDTWCTFYELCRLVEVPTIDVAVALAFQAFRGVSLELIATLAAVIKYPQFSSPVFETPSFCSLKLEDGSVLARETIISILDLHQQPFEESHESKSARMRGEDDISHRKRTLETYQSILERERNELIHEISSNWPAHLYRPLRTSLRLLGPATSVIKATIRPLLVSWAQNKAFLAHIQTFQHQLDGSMPLAQPKFTEYTPLHPPLKKRSPNLRKPTLANLMTERVPGLTHIVKMDPLHMPSDAMDAPKEFEAMHPLLRRLEAIARNKLQRDYVDNLRASMAAFKSHLLLTSMEALDNFDEEMFESFRITALQHVQFYRKQIGYCLRPTTPGARLMHTAGCWPDVTTHDLLQCLSLEVRGSLPPSWLPILIAHAVSVHDVQRITRMLQLSSTGMGSLLERELGYVRVWNPLEYPDWLLVEIEANLSIRAAQAAIAQEMLKPEGNHNTVMQLNMGEGKSSVIVPIVAASASTGHSISRVLVLGPQLKQQFQILRRTITGFCNRRIIYLPFNRKVRLDATEISRVHGILRKGAEDGAIWICEPEHLLSLKLLGLDQAIFQNSRDLIGLQTWLHDHSKDILDESDEILHARQQVIYTVGAQRSLDAAPARWEVVQKLLGLLASYLLDGDADEDLSSFLVHPPPTKSAFPIIRVQSNAAGRWLGQFIIKSFENGDWSLPPHMNDSVVEFITTPNPSDCLTSKIHTDCSGEDGRVMQTILILRAMIGREILLHGLKERRYRVQYGLDLQRSRLAIPFRAKDSPSPRSEFGHPDVTIVLTCLSYYYEGLDTEMLTHALQSLLASEAPDLIYAQWLKPIWEDVSPSLQTIRGINLQDQELLHAHVFPLLRHNKAVIDFYLNAFVFPCYAKEFPFKMATSGWDIAATKSTPTTGFSGTNDGRLLLPVTITQTDRDAQLHTNAKVLSYILKEENSRVVPYPDSACSASILHGINELSPQPTVILDVGAQILDLSNIKFAEKWLAMYRDDQAIKAVVFFDEHDNLLILTSDGAQSFIDSPYSNRLDQCLVYLDEAHTRGTDLRLPDTQAVVTLGPKLNKDKLVQGCMRMRKLGHGHKLVFIGPEEVINQIRAANGSATGDVTTEDVIVWSIKETWQQLQADLPTWVLQGHSFIRRKTAWRDLSGGNLPLPEDVSNHFCETEARTLEDLYGNQSAEAAHWVWENHSDDSQDEVARKIAERCKNFDSFNISDAGVHEEMEIELVHEKEVERVVEIAPDAEAASHVLHPNVERFVRTGEFALLHGQGFRTAANAFSGTSLAVPEGFNSVFPNIMVTEDFWRTIQLPKRFAGGEMDSFMRPVEWVVTAPVIARTLCMVLLSPYEVNQLLPLFRTSAKVKLCPFTPRSSLAASSLEDLNFLTLPSNSSRLPLPRPLAMQLNLFAGSLYFRDDKTYLDVCQTLRLHFGQLPPHLAKPNIINANFFVSNGEARRELKMNGLGFEKNSLSFFQDMIRMRRFGRGFGPSHMGKILHGTRLKEDDFVGDAKVKEGEEEEDMF